MHLKRNEMPASWPLPRKGRKFIVVPGFNRDGLPLLVILRDMLKAGRNRKEIKRILRTGKVMVNGKARRDEKFPVFILDHVGIGDKNYEVFIENNKIALRESKEFNGKIRKVVGKKIIAKGKVQINFLFGDNMLTKEKLNINDSVLIGKDGKIIKILKFAEKARALVLFGKHIGKEGAIERIEGKIMTLNAGGEKLNVSSKDIILI